jgi:GH15 family glucan-1,4-alpha-glucosidase
MASRLDGWAAIEDYGALSNGRTIALVATDGQIDWWPLPRMDTPPVFNAILDPQEGGYLELRPDDDAFTTTRRYVGDSQVLETTFHTEQGNVKVTDALTLGATGQLPWGELVRCVNGVDGEVPMRWAVRPGTRFDTARPWTEEKNGATLLHCGDQHLVLRAFDIGEPDVQPWLVRGRFTTSPGSLGLFGLTAADDEPAYVPTRAEMETRLERTIDSWHRWATTMSYHGPWDEAVRRSGLALKLLQVAETGAIAAAATTSLPERLGGDKNWDYRYMWVRDCSFTVDACIKLGLNEEAQGAISWLLHCIRSTSPRINVFYQLNGDLPGPERHLDAPGYRGSKPVRSGNGASTQTQLGNFGDLFDSVWQYVNSGHLLDAATGRVLADIADRCCDSWQSEDSGIWELNKRRHYTISKIGCWVALDRAVTLHSLGHVASGQARRWATERDAVKAWVNEHCWSTTKQSYTFFAGSEDLDAATLLAGSTGFDRSRRLAGTVAAIQRELTQGALVYRYSGAQSEEGAFVACSFWLVTALAALGRYAEGCELMDRAVRLTNDLGLMSEQIDPATGAMLGNFPQGLSHLALINAAFALETAGCSALSPVTNDAFARREDGAS